MERGRLLCGKALTAYHQPHRFGAGKPSEHYFWTVVGERRAQIAADFKAHCAPRVVIENDREVVVIGCESQMPRPPRDGERVLFQHEVGRLGGNIKSKIRRVTAWMYEEEFLEAQRHLENLPLWRAVIVEREHDDPVEDDYHLVRWQGRTQESFAESGLLDWNGLPWESFGYSPYGICLRWIKLQRRIDGGWVSWPVNGITQVLSQLPAHLSPCEEQAFPRAS